jgi:hypothetical protein
MGILKIVFEIMNRFQLKSLFMGSYWFVKRFKVVQGITFASSQVVKLVHGIMTVIRFSKVVQGITFASSQVVKIVHGTVVRVCLK